MKNAKKLTEIIKKYNFFNNFMNEREIGKIFIHFQKEIV